MLKDFEPISDQVRRDLENTPEDKAYNDGFFAGRRQARIEMLAIAGFLSFLAALVFIPSILP